MKAAASKRGRKKHGGKCKNAAARGERKNDDGKSRKRHNSAERKTSKGGESLGERTTKNDRELIRTEALKKAAKKKWGKRKKKQRKEEGNTRDRSTKKSEARPRGVLWERSLRKRRKHPEIETVGRACQKGRISEKKNVATHDIGQTGVPGGGAQKVPCAGKKKSTNQLKKGGNTFPH